MTTDAQPAAPSAAVDTTLPVASAADAAVASNDITAFRAARAAEKAGKPLTPAADSSPAQPAEQAASTEVTGAASEAAKPRKTAEDRIPELLADRVRERERAERAERKLAELTAQHTPKPDAKPAASSTASADAPFPSYDAYLEQHPDATWEQHQAAFVAHEVAKALRADRLEREQAAERESRVTSVQARDQQFRERINAAIAKDAAFLDSISPEIKALRPLDALEPDEAPTALNCLASELMASPVAPQLMRHLTDHPEDLRRLEKLYPRELLKEVALLEARFTGAAESKEAPKPVTSAPPPPTLLGNRPAAPADPEEAAVAAGDVAAYRAARLAKRAAGVR